MEIKDSLMEGFLMEEFPYGRIPLWKSSLMEEFPYGIVPDGIVPDGKFHNKKDPLDCV